MRRLALPAFVLSGLAAQLAVAAPPPAAPTASLSAERAALVQNLAALRFDRLGNPVLRWDHIPPVYAPKDKPHRLLVVLAEFPDRTFERFKGDAAQADKLVGFYQHQLFDEGYARPDTLSHYYRTQSLETYHLQGQVLPPVTLSKPRAAYGAPHRPEGGDWRNDTDSEGLAEEVLQLAAKAHPDLDWASLDRWDPTDYDGDGLLSESDGYLDHLVIIFAGGGQSSCQGLYKLQNVFNPNAQPDVLKTLSPAERECADRIWPHRFLIQKREGQGPTVEGRKHARGGAPLRADLWALDYNMQSEYTEASTFIHEFGHSIGLPDVYARQTSNSTGGWEVMSSTSSPGAQNLSAWSRLMLGWLRPKVILPPAHGGKPVNSLYLRTLDAPLETPAVAGQKQREGLWRAAMVVLPPKTRTIDLTALPKASGAWALYSGQGNELNRKAEVRLDLTAIKAPRLAFDAWWEIEAGWDFAYVEVSADEGTTWQRVLPTDRTLMPAKHGHDGKTSLPGFTGLSGDRDGDGKNESMKGCDPKKTLAHGDEKRADQKNPCLEPTWVRPEFDLRAFAGKQVRLRLRYFSDMAAVMRGILIDNVVLLGDRGGLRETFESKPGRAWTLDGFTRSQGKHTVLVPHYYLVEHRDPYRAGSYDQNLHARQSFRFFWDPSAKALRALRTRPRPGAVIWYYDGAYAWSENDPAINGQGKGFLLALDSNPNEVQIPGWPRVGSDAAFNTHYDPTGEPTQKALREAYLKMMCTIRAVDWRPRDLDPKACGDIKPQALTFEGKPLMYSYQIINTLLPGEARQRYVPSSEIHDYRIRKNKTGEKVTTWRMRDRSLRYLHTLDAPFALEPFADGVELFDIQDGKLVKVKGWAHPAQGSFSDATPARWMNPKLRFGGVAVPDLGVKMQLAPPKAGAPAGSRYKLYVEFK